MESADVRLPWPGSAIAHAGRRVERRFPLFGSGLPWLPDASNGQPDNAAHVESDNANTRTRTTNALQAVFRITGLFVQASASGSLAPPANFGKRSAVRLVAGGAMIGSAMKSQLIGILLVSFFSEYAMAQNQLPPSFSSTVSRRYCAGGGSCQVFRDTTRYRVTGDFVYAITATGAGTRYKINGTIDPSTDTSGLGKFAKDAGSFKGIRYVSTYDSGTLMLRIDSPSGSHTERFRFSADGRSCELVEYGGAGNTLESGSCRIK